MNEIYYYLYLDKATHAADVVTTLRAAKWRAEQLLAQSGRLTRVHIASGSPDDREHTPLCSLRRGGEWQGKPSAPKPATTGPRLRLSPLALRAT